MNLTTTRFLYILGVIFLWKGIWTLLDMLFIPDHPIISNVTVALLGFLAVVCLDSHTSHKVH